MASAKSWSYSAGERGRNRVRAYEDAARGTFFLEFYETARGTETGKRVRISAGVQDRDTVKRKADELAAAFGKPERPRVQAATLQALFDIYLREVSPNKGKSKRLHDIRTAELFVRCFGANRKVSTLNRRDWDRFIHERRRGTLRPPGRMAKKKEKREAGVRDRQISYDLRFLLAVLNWATLSGDGEGAMLLERNPLKGLALPKEESPRRPMLSEEQYQRLLSVAASIDWRFELALVVAHETGHRVGAIRQLRWSDIDLAAKRIRWRAENDKIGMEHSPPLSTVGVNVLAAAWKRRAAIGDGPVFPAPGDPSESVSRHLVRDWWERAMKGAGLPEVARLGWHSLRRKFVNDLKATTPMADLCYLGGWKSPMTVMTVYQQPDEATMVSALQAREQRLAASG
jgi:integrase